MATGKYPTSRHDGSAWTPADRHRAQQAGEPLAAIGLLSELRGDWAYLSSTLGFPPHNATAGLRWRCAAKPSDYKDLAGSWRQCRLKEEDFMARQRSLGSEICELLTLPGVSPHLASHDWMHAADQGVCADVIANCSRELLPEFPGASDKERCKQLWVRLRQWHQAHGVPHRLPGLTPSTFLSRDSPPKLKARAACVRHLAPFIASICAEKWSQGSHHQRTVARLAEAMQACYACLDAPAPQDLASHCQTFCELYITLEREQQDRGNYFFWRVKPKLHAFIEICQYGDGNPRATWCYQDESAGGTFAKIFAPRGGRSNATKHTEVMLHKWMALTPMPKL